MFGKKYGNKKVLTGTIGLLLAATLFVVYPGNLKAQAAEQEMETFILDDGLDNDTLLEGYMHKGYIQVSDKRPLKAGRDSKLEKVDRAVYNLLLAEIKKIAAGERESTKITVNVPVKTILGSDWKDEYSLEDFGEGYENVKDAVNGFVGYHNSKIIRSLLYDCAYELYWYDKTLGVRMSAAPVYGEADGKYKLAENSDFTFSFFVAKSYSKTGELKTYEVDTEKTTAVNTAAENANKIIADNKSKSDYEKLVAYKDNICDLNTYNKEAAGGGADYGDPWQMIYVFDGDPSTNVVCEGYSKAFKYLCDGSTFKSSLVEAWIISGKMGNEANSGGNHMWNTVRMNDGKRYLVDITNCDDNHVGRPDKLFLKGVTALDANFHAFSANAVTSKSLVYTYSSTVEDLYSAKELALSTKDYDPKGSGVNETYTVTLKPCGGEVSKTTITVLNGDDMGTLPTPVRPGYAFKGWWTAESNGSRITSSTSVISNMTIYAHWALITANVTFDCNGGTVGENTTVTVDTNIEKVFEDGGCPVPVREGYNFEGWYTGKEDGTKYEDISGLYSDLTLYAHWSAIKYTVSFDVNGGQVASGVSLTREIAHNSYLEKADMPVPTMSGYTFDGWFLQKEGGSEVTRLQVTGNVVLYAQWTVVPQEDPGSGDDNGNGGESGSTGGGESGNTGGGESGGESGGTGGNGGDSGSETGNTGEGGNGSENGGSGNGSTGESGSGNGNTGDGAGTGDNGNGSGSGNSNAGDSSTGITVNTENGTVDNALPEDRTIEYKKSSYTVDDEANATVKRGSSKDLKKVVIGDTVQYNGVTYKVTSISNNAYKNYRKLRNASIGGNVERIGAGAFKGCNSLKNITIKGNQLRNVGGNSFKGISKDAKITIICNNKTAFNKLVKKLKKAGAKNAKYKFRKN